MEGGKRDRRSVQHEPRLRPRQSPADVLVLVMVGVLAAAATATAVLGPRHDEATPHGQLLGDLQRVAEAQERHYRLHGEFARWIESLDISPSAEVGLRLVRGDARSWEAVAEHPVGLTCLQRGVVGPNGVPTRDPPGCYTP